MCLARCNGLDVALHRPTDLGQDEAVFRRAVIESVSAADGAIVVASYSRKQFLQTGDGHYSPIGAYHAQRDLVLILDVARFKYPPHWLPLSELWLAMQRVDEDTGECRGYALLRAARHCDRVGGCLLSLRFGGRWRDMRRAVRAAPAALRAAAATGPPDGLSAPAAVAALRSAGAALSAPHKSPRAAAVATHDQRHHHDRAGAAAGRCGAARSPDAAPSPAPDGCCDDGVGVGGRLSVAPSVESCLLCQAARADGAALRRQLDDAAGAFGLSGPDSGLDAAVVLALPPEVWIPDGPPCVVSAGARRLFDAEALPAELRYEVLALRQQLREILAAADDADGDADPAAPAAGGGAPV